MVKVWDVAARAVLRSYGGHAGWIWCLESTDDAGHVLVSGEERGDGDPKITRPRPPPRKNFAWHHSGEHAGAAAGCEAASPSACRHSTLVCIADPTRVRPAPLSAGATDMTVRLWDTRAPGGNNSEIHCERAPRPAPLRKRKFAPSFPCSHAPL